MHDVKANPISPERCVSVMNAMRNSAAAEVPTRVNLMIVLLPSITSPPEKEGIVIGLGGFGGIDEIERDGVVRRYADIGAMLDPEWRGKRYAVEAFRMSIDFAFRELKVDGVSCQMREVNVAMVGLVERKFGWKGMRREDKEGVEVRFEVSPEEWEEWKKR